MADDLLHRPEGRPGTSVTWKPTGPYVIEGPVVVRDNEGRELIPPPTKIPGQVKLCGCGLSKTKPFCDGSHKR
jgi:CDGSH-type Zn-finger protein